MTFDIGTRLSVTRAESSSSFIATVITPEWAKFELASKHCDLPLTPILLERIDVTVGRVAYGAYDEILCYLADVQGGVGFAFRIRNNWLVEVFQPAQGFARNYAGEWRPERVAVRLAC